jgi:predicted transcriptional regulator
MANTAEKTEIADTLRARIQRVVDDLPLEELYAIERYVSYLRDFAHEPALRAYIEAPLDDEPETPEEQAAVEEALEDVRAGRVVSHEEARQRLFGPG